MREEKIALDFDGVLADTHAATLEVYNNKNGTDLSVEDITDWEFEGIDITIPEWVELSHEAWVLWDHGYININPYQYKIDELVEKLHRNYTVDIVTNRDPQDRIYVYNWLEDHDIINHHRKLIFVQSSGKEKYEYDYDKYIDDNPYLYLKNPADIPLQYMPNRPWARHVNPGGSIRKFDSFSEIVEDII